MQLVRCAPLALAASVSLSGCLFVTRGAMNTGATSEGATPTQTVALAAGSPATLSGTAGGPVNGRSMHDGCVGFASTQPTAVLRVSEAMASAQIDVQSSSDTTLIVAHPDGTFSCNDDTDGRNPRVTHALAAGEHRVWVGTFSSGSFAPFSLSVREQSATERNASAGGAVGSIIVENRSGSDICRIEHDGGPRGQESVNQEIRIPNNGSGTLEAATSIETLWVFDCRGNVLFGRPNRSLTTPGTAHIGALNASTVTLLAPGSTAQDSPERRTLVAEPMTASEYLTGIVTGLLTRYDDSMNADRALREQAFEALQSGGRERRYIETFLSLRLTVPEWIILRHRVTGIVTGRAINGVAIARFPDGHCQATPVTFSQQHDGSDFSGRLRFTGIGGNHYVPCSIAEASTRASDWAH